MKSSTPTKNGGVFTPELGGEKVFKGAEMAGGLMAEAGDLARMHLMRREVIASRNVLRRNGFVVCVSPVMQSERVWIAGQEGAGGVRVSGGVAEMRCITATAESSQTPSFVRFVTFRHPFHGFTKKTAAWLQSAL